MQIFLLREFSFVWMSALMIQNMLYFLPGFLHTGMIFPGCVDSDHNLFVRHNRRELKITEQLVIAGVDRDAALAAKPTDFPIQFLIVGRGQNDVSVIQVVRLERPQQDLDSPGLCQGI